jgi:poly-gamma-glutamate synthesis protein (capsule biosynthesis protein)
VIAPRSFTIAAAGDVLIHRRISEVARTNPGEYDFSPMFSLIKPWIEVADLAICHLEVTLSPDNSGLAFFPKFVAPHEIADAIAAAGYDTCSIAGNHALDAGWPGVVTTLDFLDAAGVRHDGTARNQEERLPGLYEVAGVTVAHLSYTYGTNGQPIPPDHPYAINVIDAPAILADARWARDNGAEFVIVSLHWGLENVVGPTGSQVALAEILLGSPYVDLILGAHAHVVQPIGQINGKYVVYGMGNQLSNQNGAFGEEYFSTEDGLTVLIRVSERPDGTFAADGIDIVPTWVRNLDYQIFAVANALAEGVTPTWALETSLQRTQGRVRSLGAPGIRLAPSPPPTAPCACRHTIDDLAMSTRWWAMVD